MFCPNCGQKIENGVKYCSECGKMIESFCFDGQVALKTNVGNVLVEKLKKTLLMCRIGLVASIITTPILRTLLGGFMYYIEDTQYLNSYDSDELTFALIAVLGICLIICVPTAVVLYKKCKRLSKNLYNLQAGIISDKEIIVSYVNESDKSTKLIFIINALMLLCIPLLVFFIFQVIASYALIDIKKFAVSTKNMHL